MTDLFPWLGVVAAGLPISGWLLVRRGSGFLEDRLTLAVLPPCALLLSVFVAERIAAAPYWDWNAARLVGAFALARGHDIYSTLAGGATFANIYGPIFSLLFLPLAQSSFPTTAIVLATTLTVACFFLPALVFHLLPGAGRQRTLATGLLGFVAFGLVACLHDGLRYSGFSVHPDAPTILLISGACMLLLTGPRQASTRRLVAIGLLMALAVWCKQPAAPIVLVLPLWIGLTRGRHELVRSLLVFGAVGVVVSAALLLAFGVRDLFFNMFALPAAVPWRPHEGGRWDLHLRALIWTSVPFVLMAAAGAILDQRPANRSEARSFSSVWRWFRRPFSASSSAAAAPILSASRCSFWRSQPPSRSPRRPDRRPVSRPGFPRC